MDTPLVVSGPVPGIHVFLSRDGKEVDGRDKLGHDRDGIEAPVGDRLINERAECKRFLARPNVQI
jgi:hypothetical protein